MSFYSNSSQSLLASDVFTRDRGPLMLLCMKLISVPSTTTLLGLFAYAFDVSSVMFGPWVSYERHRLWQQGDTLGRSASLLTSVLRCAATMFVASTMLIYSTCFLHWLLPDPGSPILLAWRTASSYRSSHYFICYLSSAAQTIANAK